jgi:hypothetical protein
MEEHLKGVILEKAFMGDMPRWYQHFSFIRDMLTFNWLWTPFMAWGLWLLAKKIRKDHSTALFILIWAFTLPVAMSIARYRMPWYLIQVFPALALAAGLAMSEIFSEANRIQWTKRFMMVGMVVVILINILPFPLDGDREKDVRVIAPYVKHFAEKGAKLMAFNEDFYGLNNALLFFSDYAAQPIFQKPEEVKPVFENSGLVLCVVHRADLPRLNNTVSHLYRVKDGQDLLLVANQPVETSDIKTW